MAQTEYLHGGIGTRMPAGLEPLIRETLDIPTLRTELEFVGQGRFGVRFDPVRQIVAD